MVEYISSVQKLLIYCTDSWNIISFYRPFVFQPTFKDIQASLKSIKSLSKAINLSETLKVISMHEYCQYNIWLTINKN